MRPFFGEMNRNSTELTHLFPEIVRNRIKSIRVRPMSAGVPSRRRPE